MTRSQVEQLLEEKHKLMKERDELAKQNVELSAQNAKLVGHQNPKQKIQLHVKVKASILTSPARWT